jgi:hypothetical protein
VLAGELGEPVEARLQTVEVVRFRFQRVEVVTQLADAFVEVGQCCRQQVAGACQRSVAVVDGVE